ncbi:MULTISPECIES: OmpA family protein [Pseudomonas]|uniref:OmpA family protein n=1 Tax=Pseudomonas TaxID=286 RepID=UPI00226F7683|nr:OmpA family protein [Pseudomonas putida]WAB98334.1 OmpA family protein [Pseudomonas putida]
MHRAFRLTALSCAFITAAGCSTQQMDTLSKKVKDIGRDYGMPVLCGVGVVAGGAAGYALKGKDGILPGAAVGGAVGCVVGYAWQSRLQELDRIAKEENLKITTEKLTVASAAVVTAVPEQAGLVTQIEDSGMFATGSDQLTPSGKRAVAKLAQMYAKPAATDKQAAAKESLDRRLLIVGHSDAVGNAEFNQKLSERRAKTVGKVMLQAGIPAHAIYYQGAGASRPIADNSDPLLRGQNRRVEIVELANEQALVMRAQAEAGNTRYLHYGTSTAARSKAAGSAKASSTPTRRATAMSGTGVAKTPGSTPPTKAAAAARPQVDFAGTPVASYNWTMAQSIKPKQSGFTLISSAYAAQMPMSSCEADRPRTAGEVLSMANDQPLPRHATKDYLPGYNNRVWANLVNGHLVTVSPVSILRENAKVDRQPILQLVEDYKLPTQHKPRTMKAVANTYEGESEVLYRVFASDAKASISCMDIVFSKGNAQASQGALFYAAGGDAFVAAYTPIPATK